MVGLQTLDLAIGVRVPASQPKTQTLTGGPKEKLRTSERGHSLLIMPAIEATSRGINNQPQIR